MSLFLHSRHTAAWLDAARCEVSCPLLLGGVSGEERTAMYPVLPTPMLLLLHTLSLSLFWILFLFCKLSPSFPPCGLRSAAGANARDYLFTLRVMTFVFSHMNFLVNKPPLLSGRFSCVCWTLLPSYRMCYVLPVPLGLAPLVRTSPFQSPIWTLPAIKKKTKQDSWESEYASIV